MLDLEVLTIRGKDKLGLVLCRFRASFKLLQCIVGLTFGAGGDVNMVAL